MDPRLKGGVAIEIEERMKKIPFRYPPPGARGPTFGLVLNLVLPKKISGTNFEAYILQ